MSHPTYFGDIRVYVGWALFSVSPWAWLSLATNVAQYLFDAIPKNENWAAEQYGQSWSDYAARTSRLIPRRRRN
jgi:protein-S-isoprenylcysteine O-methyltransferase Ste14